MCHPSAPAPLCSTTRNLHGHKAHVPTCGTMPFSCICVWAYASCRSAHAAVPTRNALITGRECATFAYMFAPLRSATCSICQAHSTCAPASCALPLRCSIMLACVRCAATIVWPCLLATSCRSQYVSVLLVNTPLCLCPCALPHKAFTATRHMCPRVAQCLSAAYVYGRMHRSALPIRQCLYAMR